MLFLSIRSIFLHEIHKPFKRWLPFNFHELYRRNIFIKRATNCEMYDFGIEGKEMWIKNYNNILMCVKGFAWKLKLKCEAEQGFWFARMGNRSSPRPGTNHDTGQKRFSFWLRRCLFQSLSCPWDLKPRQFVYFNCCLAFKYHSGASSPAVSWW